MDKLRITQVLWTLGRGGAERMVFDLCRFLKKEHDIDVLSAGGGEMAADFEAEHISVRSVHDRPTSPARKEAYAFFKRAFQEKRPDILHTHLGGDIWGGLAAKSLRITPWIITAHSHEPRLPLAQRLGRLWAYWLADHVVCVSEGVRNAVLRLYRIPKRKTSVIRIGIDEKKFPQRPPHLAGDIVKIVSVGRLVPEKDHATLLRALARVDRPWRLEIVGDGPERIALTRLAETLGILPRVTFLGTTNDVGAKLRSADLFCLPSRHEGQGLVVFEAAAAGIPVIASNLDALRETFDAESMQFVPAGDAEAWAQTIEASITRYGETLRKASRAREIVTKEYTLERMGEAYVSLYERLLKHHA